MDAIQVAINNLPTTGASFGDEAPEVVAISKDAVLSIVNTSFSTFSQMLATSAQKINDLTAALADRINKCSSVEKAMEGCKEMASHALTDMGQRLENANQTSRELAEKLSTSEAALEAAKVQLAALPARILKLGERGLLIGGIGAGAVAVGYLGSRYVHKESTWKKATFNLISFAGFAAMCFVLFNRPLSTAAQTLSQWSFTK